MAQLPPTTRRDEIVAGAAELFARNGIAATTVRDIGEAVGMLSGSLYHYFTSKEEIVDAIISSYLDDLRLRYRDAIENVEDPIEQLRALIHASFHSVAEYPAACEIYQKDFGYLTQLPRFAYMKRTASQTQKIWMETIQQGIDQGLFVKDLDPGDRVPLHARRDLDERALAAPGGSVLRRRGRRRMLRAVPRRIPPCPLMRARCGPSSTSAPTAFPTRCSRSTSTTAG